MTITFETKCYHRDWRFLLEKGYLEDMISACNFGFDKKVIFLNNFDDYREVKLAADKLVESRLIDEYYVVSEYADEALRFFNLDKDSFAGGYYYSIAELVSIYLCSTDYLLHFSGDSMMEPCPADWITDGMKVMEKDHRVLVANPAWNHKYDEAKEEAFEADSSWYYSYGFSDQCYLIKPGNFKKQIYHEKNTSSDRYPMYGGELFEKRVDAYMRNHRLIRITHKTASYVHNNFPKNKLGQYLKLRLGI